MQIFRSLDAVTGGDDRVNAAWLRNENTALHGVPAALMKTLTGLMSVASYLGAQRAKI